MIFKEADNYEEKKQNRHSLCSGAAKEADYFNIKFHTPNSVFDTHSNNTEK